MLTQIISLFEVFTAYFAGVRYFGGFVSTLVYHQIIRFCKTPLAILANELTLRTHLAAEIRPTVIVVDSHYSKHFDVYYLYFLFTHSNN